MDLLNCCECGKDYPPYVLSKRTSKRVGNAGPTCPFCLSELLGRYLTSEDFDLQSPVNMLITVGTFIGISNRNRIPTFAVWANNDSSVSYDYDENEVSTATHAALKFHQTHDLRDGSVIRVQGSAEGGIIHLYHLLDGRLSAIGHSTSGGRNG